MYEKASREFSISATVGKQIEIYQPLLRRLAAENEEAARKLLEETI